LGAGLRGIAMAQVDASSSARLNWIYGFWSSLAPYAYARLEDEVVILPPNLVYKTNATGARLLDFLGRGGRFEDIPGFDQDKATEIEAFFRQLKAVYEGRPAGLESIPYDFSFTRLPVLGEIAVTYRCNNRCRFCYAGCDAQSTTALAADGPSAVGKGPATDGQSATASTAAGQTSAWPGSAALAGPELDTAGMKRVIDCFRDEARIPFFSFTGGEPLLRQDLELLAAHARSRGLRVNLVTNGILATAERAAALFAAGVSTAQVSLEAADPAVHDRLCGVAGAWEGTLAGIRALQAAGVSVQTNSTLTNENRDALLELPAFVASLGIRRMSMNLFIPVGSGATARELFFPYSRVGAFVDEVRRRALAAGVDFFWYSPTPLCIYNPIARGLGNKSCAACDGLLSVSPAGAVLPCSSFAEPVGNLLTDGFRAVWFSDRAMFFKRKRYAPPSCQGCASFTACQSACPLYWQYAGCDEIAGKAVPQPDLARLQPLQVKPQSSLVSRLPVAGSSKGGS
jgi:radical SAM protein with 4Fe4S-binding SPASM domain